MKTPAKILTITTLLLVASLILIPFAFAEEITEGLRIESARILGANRVGG